MTLLNWTSYLAQFKDVYEDRLRTLIEAKVEGREIVAPPAEKAPALGNLMEALERSLAEAKNKSKSRSSKPSKLAAPSVGVKAKDARRRKSS